MDMNKDIVYILRDAVRNNFYSHAPESGIWYWADCVVVSAI